MLFYCDLKINSRPCILDEWNLHFLQLYIFPFRWRETSIIIYKVIIRFMDSSFLKLLIESSFVVFITLLKSLKNIFCGLWPRTKTYSKKKKTDNHFDSRFFQGIQISGFSEKKRELHFCYFIASKKYIFYGKVVHSFFFQDIICKKTLCHALFNWHCRVDAEYLPFFVLNNTFIF